MKLNRAERRIAGHYIRQENAKQPERLEKIPRGEWRPECTPPGLIEAWRNKKYLVQVYTAPEPATARLSVINTALDSIGGWQSGITWDELQQLKAECGFGNCWAVEIFPPEDKIVRVSNMRHLFVVPESHVPFGWGAGESIVQKPEEISCQQHSTSPAGQPSST